MMASVREIA